MRKTVYFRADGNSEIGLGHVTRLLSIANMIQKEYDCVFIIKTPSDAIAETIERTCLLCRIPAGLDFNTEADYLSDFLPKAPFVLILDGYQFVAAYQKRLKENPNCLLVCIDDSTPIEYWSDVVINHAGNLLTSDYKTALYTKFCLGSKYAMLRQCFLKVTGEQRNINGFSKLFICLGGADPLNLSKAALDAALALEQIEEIHLVLGNAYPHFETLDKLLQAHSNRVFLYKNLSGEAMVKIMQSCSFALVSSSGIAYEASCIGIGLLIVKTAENQEGIYNFLTANGLAKGLRKVEEGDLSRLLQSLSLEQVQVQIKQQRAFFKDSSLQFQKLITRLFLMFEIEIRPAKISDMYTYFEWANDPEARLNAIHPEPIPLKVHKRWFLNKIHSKNNLLFYFQYKEKPLGRLRFDIDEGKYTISYTVDKQFRGQGFGELLVKKALEEIAPHFDKDNYSVFAEVKPENIASQKVFEHLGFEQIGVHKYNNGAEVLCYEKRQII